MQRTNLQKSGTILIIDLTSNIFRSFLQVVELKRMSERLDCSLMASTASVLNCDLKDVFDEYYEDSEKEEDSFVWGLGCRDNRTLNFYVLDSLTQWSLRQKLGLEDAEDKEQALILSLNEEKIYKMEAELNRQNLQVIYSDF